MNSIAGKLNITQSPFEEIDIQGRDPTSIGSWTAARNVYPTNSLSIPAVNRHRQAYTQDPDIVPDGQLQR